MHDGAWVEENLLLRFAFYALDYQLQLLFNPAVYLHPPPFTSNKKNCLLPS